jgi:hypothetical protein
VRVYSEGDLQTPQSSDAYSILRIMFPSIRLNTERGMIPIAGRCVHVIYLDCACTSQPHALPRL